MEKVRCRRCDIEGLIPTFQYVKFDGDVQYLCDACWQMFRRWFFAADRIEKRETNPPA